MGIIYLIRNQVTGLCYVGQTIQKLKSRMKSHAFDAREGSKTKLHTSIRDYGWDNHIYGVIETTSNLDEREVYWIEYYNTLNEGLNSAEGGGFFPVFSGENHPMHGKTHSSTSREKISANHANVSGVNNPRARPHKIIFCDDTEIIVDCLKEWCYNKGYNYGGVTNFKCKVVKSSRKYNIKTIIAL